MNKNKGFVRLAFTLVAVFAAGDLCAQSLRVTAANSSTDNAVYDVLFNPAGTTLLNSDGGCITNSNPCTAASFRSAVFVPGSASGGADLIVADTAGGRIVRYAAPSGSPTEPSVLVWSAASGGPQSPDGLSVDSAGNLYVISNNPSAVWVFPAASGGGFSTPKLLYQFGGDFGSKPEADALVESVVVPGTSSQPGPSQLAANGISAGDLLVLVADTDSDPTDRNEGVTVFDFSAASIATFLTSGTTPTPKAALNEKQILPTGYRTGTVPQPTGMDVSPVDGSLLLSTNTGMILQFQLPAGPTTALWTNITAATFANITASCASTTSPPCFGKLRAGAQTNGASTTAYVFVAQPTGTTSGNILEFAGPAPSGGFTAATVTASVTVTTGSPEGLAVAQSAFVAAVSTCATTTGCNPSGGLNNAITNGVTGAGATGVTGNVIQQKCIITDTRLITTSGPTYGSCPGTINISQACQGFPANIIASDTICGASGPKGNQLAVLLSIANGVDDVPGILVQSQADPSTLIPGAAAVPCTNKNQSVGWTTRLGSNEGTTPNSPNVEDMSTFCDKGGTSTKGNSVWVVGGQLSTAVTSSTANLVAFANQKFQALSTTIQAGPIAASVQSQLAKCVSKSMSFLSKGKYICSAYYVWSCDQIVANNASSFSSSSTNPNPFGDVRGRLGNLFYHINTRIAGQPANTAWPLTSPLSPGEDCGNE